MRQNNTRVSIITVCYNAASSIEETILSVVNQTYTNIEYIVIDGGSTDGTTDIIKKYADRITLWTSERDKGVYDAMNKGIRKATGEWINFMNSGDYFVDSRKVEEIFSTPHKADILYGNFRIAVGKLHYTVLPEDLKMMREHLPFCHQTAFVRTALAKQHEFDTRFRYAADFDFFHKMYLEKHSFEYVNQTVAFYDTVQGLTANNNCRMFDEIYHIAGIRRSKKQELLQYWSERIKQLIPQWLTQRIRVCKYRKHPRFVLDGK